MVSKFLVAPWAVTQGVSIQNQLLHGVRVLDLRIGQLAPGDYIIVHDIWRTTYTIESALDEIYDFVDGAEKEIVFLRFVRFLNLDGSPLNFDYDQLKTIVHNKLSSYILQPTSCADSTLSDIWSLCPGKRVVIFWKDTDSIDDTYMRPNMDEKWYDEYPVTTLFDEIATDLSNPVYEAQNDQKFWVISAFLKTNFPTGTPNNNAISLSPTLSRWFYGGSKWAYEANVISTDFLNDYSNFVEASVVSNLLKAAAKP